MLSRLRRPKTTVRWRLALLYGGLFLASGAALLAITYTLVSHAKVEPIAPHGVRRVLTARPRHLPPGIGPRFYHVPGKRAVPPQANFNQVTKLLRTRNGGALAFVVGSNQRISDLHSLIVESGIALGIMAIISGLLGWLVAGRVLRPLRTMTATTQQISEANLHERLDMAGPRDELRQLADTIDGLLARLEAAFEAQRRFVANASHELRTPLTAVRALLEMVMSDPKATVKSFRAACEQVLEESEHQEQLIDALLALAQGQRGVDRRQPMDLADVTRQVVTARETDAAMHGLVLDAELQSAPISGDRRLIERLVSNLVDNAIAHNLSGGDVRVSVRPLNGDAVLRIANSGPEVPAAELERLLQPFQRLGADRVGYEDGLGLGLSIVAAIANAHDATLELRPGHAGGLQATVRFPLTLAASVVMVEQGSVRRPGAEGGNQSDGDDHSDHHPAREHESATGGAGRRP
jgi:signal transduction histidine kinase